MLADSDVTSLEILLTPLLGLAYGYGLRLVRNSAEAEDLLQEAALASDYAYRQVAHLSNNIGPRLSGSAQAEKAVEYVANELRSRKLNGSRL